MAEKKLNKIIVFFATQKFRIDLAASFITLINFMLLAITSSDKIQVFIKDYAHTELSLSTIVIGMIVIMVFSVWLTGYILDKKAGYWQGMQTVKNKRDLQISELLDNTRSLKLEIESLKQTINEKDKRAD